MMKRFCDILISTVGLLSLWPLFALVAVAIKLDSKGAVIFKQVRIGRCGKPFNIYKFRTMIENSESSGSRVTVAHDSRITGVGKLLRKWKIDELPQLFNVFKGDMSFVGPRPEVREYVDLYNNDYAEILKIRPGITDLASIKYRNESDILSRCEDPKTAYEKEILPDKIRLAREYIRNSSIHLDLKIVLSTLFG